MRARATSVAQPSEIRTVRSEGLPLGKVSFIDRGGDSLPVTGSMLVIDDSRRVEQAGVRGLSVTNAWHGIAAGDVKCLASFAVRHNGSRRPVASAGRYGRSAWSFA